METISYHQFEGYIWYLPRVWRAFAQGKRIILLNFVLHEHFKRKKRENNKSKRKKEKEREREGRERQRESRYPCVPTCFGGINTTSVECVPHVDSLVIWYEVVRPGFFCSVVQLTNIFTNDKVITLASDLFLASHHAHCRISSLYCFKCVAFEKHSINGGISRATLTSSFNESDPVHRKRNCQPEMWLHL